MNSGSNRQPFLVNSCIFGIFSEDFDIFNIQNQDLDNTCAFFFRGSFRDIGLPISSLTSFVASTRPIRPGVGAIDSPDHSRHIFDQYDPSKVPETFSRATFRWLVVKKCSFLVFSNFNSISNFAYYDLYQRKLKAITRKNYAIHFLIQPLDFSLEIREDESDLHGSPKKNLEAVSKNKSHTSSP